MTDLAIVASKRDAQFAEAVHAGLQASGHDADLSEILPQQSGSHVVLIWSAALESAHAIDAQALIGLWSENRLLVVRRDETPLPLGLRDLESLDSAKSPLEVCAAVTEAMQGVLPLFSLREPRPLYSKPDDRKYEAPPAFSRSPSPGLPDPEVKKKSSLGTKVLAAVVFAGVAFSGWYYYTAGERTRVAVLTAAFEAATKATDELNRAKQAEVEAQKRAAEARAAEEATKISGDAAALKAATDVRSKAEADATAQAMLVQQREADVRAKQGSAKKAKEDGDKRAEAARKEQQVAKVEAPKQEIVAKDEPAPRAERLSRAEPAPKPEPAPKAEAKTPRAMTRSERESQRDSEVAAKAIGKPAEQVAAASPSAVAPAAKRGSDSETMYQQALEMENSGKAAEAIRFYRRAARAGSGKAAKRLGDIFDRGVPGVSRDYAESLQWYETARSLGESVEVARSRGSGTPEIAVPAPKPTPVARPPAPVVPKVAAPAPVPEAPKAAATAPVLEAPKAATPVPVTEKAPAPPSPAAESAPSYAIVIVFALLALVVILWRRSRRSTVQAPQSQAARPATQAPADAATLFVSYSHKDKTRVEPIVSLIEGMGRRVWMDRSDITGQTGWAGQIVRAIRECRAVVLMASPNSYASDQVVRELYLAMNHKKTIVPIEIEPADLPDELQYILAPFQHHRLSGRETREVLGRALAAV